MQWRHEKGNGENILSPAGSRKGRNTQPSNYKISETAEIIQLLLTTNINKYILVIRADFLNLNCMLPIIDYFKRH